MLLSCLVAYSGRIGDFFGLEVFNGILNKNNHFHELVWIIDSTLEKVS